MPVPGGPQKGTKSFKEAIMKRVIVVVLAVLMLGLALPKPSEANGEWVPAAIIGGIIFGAAIASAAHHPAPVYAQPAAPVYVQPYPVYAHPRPVYVQPRPVVVYGSHHAPQYYNHGGYGGGYGYHR
jgi:hypothetical protein